MAGYVDVEENGSGEDDSLPSKTLKSFNDLLGLNNKATTKSLLAITSTSTASSTTRPRNALITKSPGTLNLRQNNPQDCANLIIASVDRATVEISRTIIALNATFSQQLQEASISASNGIKSAEASASTNIRKVVENASITTSSVLSSLTIANLAVASLSSASMSDIAKVSSASSSDVSTLSSSASLLRLSISSLQASAASALASAQSALSSASVASNAAAGVPDDAAAPAPAGVLAGSAGPAAAPTQVCATGTLPLAQVLAIGIGAIIVVTLLSFAIYFMVVMMKRRKQARDSYFDEKNFAASPKILTSRNSSSTRTGNAITLKFNRAKLPEEPIPSKPKTNNSIPSRVTSFSMERNLVETSKVDRRYDSSASILPSWPLTLSFMRNVDVALRSPVTSIQESRPLEENIPASVSPKGFSSQPKNKALSSSRHVPAMNSTMPEVAQPSTIIESLRSPQGEIASTATAASQRLTVPLSLPPTTFIELESPRLSPTYNLSDDSIEETTLRELPTKPHESTLVNEHTIHSADDQPRHNIASEVDISGSWIIEDNARSWSTYLTYTATESPDTTIESNPEPIGEIVPKSEMANNPRPETESASGAVIDTTPEPEIEKNPEPIIEWARPSPVLIAKVSEDEISVEKDEQDEINMVADPVESSCTPAKKIETIEVDMIEAEIPQTEVTETIHRESLFERGKTMLSRRDVSYLQPNIYTLNQTPSPTEPEKSLLVVSASENVNEDEGASDIHEERGRSMIRTSDIIECRLSGIKSTTNYPKSAGIVQNQPIMERAFSPLKLNPVGRSMSPMPTDPGREAKSPLATDPKRRSNSLLSLSNNHSLGKIITNNTLGQVDSSPLQNPVRKPLVGASTKLSAAAIASRPRAKDKFAQILAQFRYMADQNPIDSTKASQEVTHRAIAGIAIPSSMREQAVRNTGKSRERG